MAKKIKFPTSNEPGYCFDIPTGLDKYSNTTWILPDKDILHETILNNPTIYHVGHLAEDCELFFEDQTKPIGHDDEGNARFKMCLSHESVYLRKIREITQKESDKGTIILYQKKIRKGIDKTTIYPKSFKQTKSIVKRARTKPIFEYHSYPMHAKMEPNNE